MSELIDLKQKIPEISYEKFLQMKQGTKILVFEGVRKQVLLTPHDKIIKTFRYRKKHLYRRNFPAAKKFIAVTKRFKEMNFASVQPESLQRCREQDFDVVVYPLLPGRDVRSIIHSGDLSILDRVPAFLAEIHTKKIYFRAGHLGNILLTDDNRFGMIDVENTRFSKMSLRRRAKSLAYLLTHIEDICLLRKYGYKKFIQNYLKLVNFNKLQAWVFRKILNYYIKKRIDRHVV